MTKTLVIGIGNIGRADDGLGWAFVDMLQNDVSLEVQYRYQLQIEDAELISHYNEVWFVDASHTSHRNGFKEEILQPASDFTYTTHALHPSVVLQLCHDIYGALPVVHLLAISGEEWGLRNGMSTTAKERLALAFDHFQNVIKVPANMEHLEECESQ